MMARFVDLVLRDSRAMADFVSGTPVQKILATKAWHVTIPIPHRFSDAGPVLRVTEGTVSTVSPQLVNSDPRLASK